MLVTSRSYAEYLAMFDLEARSVVGRVLDCCAGASGFVAELSARGGEGVAVDPVYTSTPAELEQMIPTNLGTGQQIIDAHADRFVWDWYGSPERRDAMRREAARLFLDDVERRPERYVAASLPHLPFEEGSFDLVLCSHLLFTWADELDEDWHHAALQEMVRVTRREVRVFPLVLQGTGEEVDFLPAVMERLRDAGHEVEVVRVPYVFQRGADRMLRVRRG